MLNNDKDLVIWKVDVGLPMEKNHGKQLWTKLKKLMDAIPPVKTLKSIIPSFLMKVRLLVV